MNDDNEITIKFDIIIEYKGYKILNSQVAAILKTLKEKGSIIGTSKVLGISYSKLYDIIARIERLAGKKIIETRCGGKGGGGTILTEFGERLLSLYEAAQSKLVGTGLTNYSQYITKEHNIVIAHGHDPALATAFMLLSRDGVGILSLCLASGLSLAMLSLGLTDIACVHLYDLETKKFNIPFLEKFWLKDYVEHLGGYMRQMVFICKPGLHLKSVDEIVLGILKGELTIAGRNRGSGTQILLECLLREYAYKYSMDVNRVRGINADLQTHDEVARHVRLGKADVGLTLRYIAEKYNLNYVPVIWEFFECYALKTRINNAIHKFKHVLTSDEFNRIINNMPGYKSLSRAEI